VKEQPEYSSDVIERAVRMVSEAQALYARQSERNEQIYKAIAGHNTYRQSTASASQEPASNRLWIAKVTAPIMPSPKNSMDSTGLN